MNFIKVRIFAKNNEIINNVKYFLKDISCIKLESSLCKNAIDKKLLTDIDCDLLIIDSRLIDSSNSLSAITDSILYENSQNVACIIYAIGKDLLDKLENLNIPYITDKFSKEKVENIFFKQLFCKKIKEINTKNLKLESLSIIAGGTAHDFNNIVGAIMGYTELLKFKVKGGSDVTKYIDYMLKSCIKAQQLIDLLTKLSRNWEQQNIFKIPAHVILKETIKNIKNRYHIEKTIFEDITKENDLIEVKPFSFYSLCNILVKNMLELISNSEPLKISLNLVDYSPNNSTKSKGKKYLELKILGAVEKNKVISKMDEYLSQIEEVLQETKGYFEYVEDSSTKDIGIRVLLPAAN